MKVENQNLLLATLGSAHNAAVAFQVSAMEMASEDVSPEMAIRGMKDAIQSMELIVRQFERLAR